MINHFNVILNYDIKKYFQSAVCVCFVCTSSFVEFSRLWLTRVSASVFSDAQLAVLIVWSKIMCSKLCKYFLA